LRDETWPWNEKSEETKKERKNMIGIGRERGGRGAVPKENRNTQNVNHQYG